MIEPDPCHTDHGSVEAAKPGIDVIVRRSGLAGQILAPELHRPCRRACADDVAHHGRHDECIAGIDDPLRVSVRYRGLRLRQHVAASIDDVVDQIGRDAIPAVREYRVGTDHLQRRGSTRA